MGIPIKTYVCKKKCFFRDRVWSVGETLQAKQDEVPKHFVLKEKYVPEEKEVPQDPQSLSEFQKEEAKQVLAGVGHSGVKPANAEGQPAAAPATEAPKNAEGESGVEDAFK